MIKMFVYTLTSDNPCFDQMLSCKSLSMIFAEALSSHEDLLYNWTKDGEILNTTQFPVYGLVFDSVAVYNVSITVFNMSE